tara:strand:- start:1940 stop:2587 length:648 start_codon:yes stop_codon:yes gene_type:complete
METKPTEKYFGQPTRPKSTRTELAPKYDRAVTKAAGQKDFRSTFKVYLGNFLVTNFGMGNVEQLVSRMTEEEKSQAAKDLNIMRYIYSGKSPYETTGSNNVATGTLYDDQPEVVGSPVEKIDAVLNDMGMQIDQAPPTDAEMEEVYIYYIKPNYHTVLGPESEPPKVNRFASHMASIQNPEFMKRQRELDAINRRKAIERNRQLAQNRRRRMEKK